MGAMLLAPPSQERPMAAMPFAESQKHRAHGALLRDHVKRIAAGWREPLVTARARRRR